LIETAKNVFARRWVQLGLGTVASVGLAYVAVNSLAWGEVADTFRHFPVDYALLSTVPLIAAMGMRAARWSVLLQHEGVSFPHVFITQNAGIGLNNMLPVRVGSEALQLGLITRRYKVPLAPALASLVGGNVLDIFATGILMAIGVVLVPGLRDGAISIQLFGAVIMLTVSLLVLLGVSRGMNSIPIAGQIAFFRRVIGSLSELRGHPKWLALSFAATFTHWFLMGVSGWILAEGLGIDTDPLTMATLLVAATFFTSAMLSLPGGAGTYHFAIVAMLTAMGADGEVAFSFAMVMHVMIFLPPMLIALAVMFRAGTGALMHRGMSPNWSVPSGASEDDDGPGKTT
jgi:uncharacterized protein (TIRG00374 family)